MAKETAARPVSLVDIQDGISELISTTIGVTKQLYDMAVSAEEYPIEHAYWNMRSTLLDALRKVSIEDVYKPDFYPLETLFAWAKEGKKQEEGREL